jgi:hypothetical protein
MSEYEKVCINCTFHKKEGMVDLKHKPCIEEGCQNRSIYNFKDAGQPIYCKEHKK